MIATSIRLKPTKATLQLTQSKGPATHRRISIEAQIADGDEIRTDDKRVLNECRWVIEIHERDAFNEKASSMGAMGFLSHHAQRDDPFYSLPESCFASIAVSTDLFSSLLGTLQADRLPNTVTLEVLELRHGWEPDGSSVIWDIDAFPYAPIMSSAFSTTLIDSRNLNDDMERIYTDHAFNARGGKEHALSLELKALSAAVLSHLRWIAAILAVCAAGVFLRR